MSLDEVTQMGGVEFSEPFHQQNLYFYSLSSVRLLGILVIGKTDKAVRHRAIIGLEP